MNTAEYLKSKNIIVSTDLETRFNLKTSRDGHIQTVKNIVAAFDELVNYKELLIKYVKHVQFFEGIDYLSESFTDGSTEITEKEAEEIQKLLE